MPIYLKQSTASQEIPLGYFVDSTDGDTAETGLTIANTDIQIWKNGATTLANKNSGGATHIAGGIYYAVLDATDTNTLGPLVVFCHVSGALAVRVECVVLAANVFDSLIAASDALQVDTIQVGGTVQTANDNGADINAILADTDELQTNQGNWVTATGFMPDTEDGSSFTAIPWNATWDAEVQSEAADALVAINLDHLMKTAVSDQSQLGASGGNEVVDGTVLGAILATGGDPDNFNLATDSLQSIRDHIGDGTNLTEAGGTGDQLTAIPYNAAWDAEIQSECADALNAYDPPTKAELDTAQGAVQADIAALENISAADVNAEVVDVIRTDVIPDSLPADGNRPTVAQALLLIARFLTEKSVSSTTLTVNKEDGSTACMTFTLNDDTNPSSITRAT